MSDIRIYRLFYIRKANGNVRPMIIDLMGLSDQDGQPEDYLVPGDKVEEDLGLIEVKGDNAGMMSTSMVGEE